MMLSYRVEVAAMHRRWAFIFVKRTVPWYTLQFEQTAVCRIGCALIIAFMFM
jgi:hypothetical protein